MYACDGRVPSQLCIIDGHPVSLPHMVLMGVSLVLLLAVIMLRFYYVF